MSKVDEVEGTAATPPPSPGSGGAAPGLGSATSGAPGASGARASAGVPAAPVAPAGPGAPAGPAASAAQDGAAPALAGPGTPAGPGAPATIGTGSAFPAPARRRRRWIGLAAVAVVVAAAATGAGLTFERASAPEDPAPFGPGDVTIELGIEHSLFEAETIRIYEGTRVRFVLDNGDPIGHELIVGGPDVHAVHAAGTHARHGSIAGEVSVGPKDRAMTTFQFDDPGEVEFACHLPGHYEYGMHGTIEVVARP